MVIELTEDDFGWSYSGDDKHVIIDIARYPRFKNPYTIEEGKQLKQQILFNQKVVSYLRELHPDIISDKGFDTGAMVQVHQNQKLRELIEKRIEVLQSETREDQVCRIIEELQKLLKESNEN